jgi:hypothetical protein
MKPGEMPYKRPSTGNVALSIKAITIAIFYPSLFLNIVGSKVGVLLCMTGFLDLTSCSTIHEGLCGICCFVLPLR